LNFPSVVLPGIGSAKAMQDPGRKPLDTGRKKPKDSERAAAAMRQHEADTR
jgi:hypothetical protein